MHTAYNLYITNAYFAKIRLLFFVTLLLSLSLNSAATAQPEHSVARQWNELVLTGIRNDFARPTIHARNLFHTSVVMYDAWATITKKGTPYFLDNPTNGFETGFEGFNYGGENPEAAVETAISYAVYRLMEHRYRNSPDYQSTKTAMDSLMQTLDYDIDFFSTDYQSGNPAALGNFLAEQLINYGLQDGANELGNYQNRYYEPFNNPLPLVSGGPNPLYFPNRWQPLEFDEAFIDQSGNVVNPGIIDFLSPEWGEVTPFALDDTDHQILERDGHEWSLFTDPGHPPYLDTLGGNGFEDPYKWGFLMVSAWQSHLDATHPTLIDISPNSLGNIPFDSLPQTIADYPNFYNFLEGGDIGKGYETNPATGQPYAPQLVPRGDYGRVLAEFWADGPDSETPPGHWFVLLNYATDHPAFERKFKGEGQELPILEYDVKAYLALGGAMHDAAIAAWSVKGFYDYIRPISAIRYMATMGQSTDPALPNYSPKGIPLVAGISELVSVNDTLVGKNQENLNKVKLFTWKGHDYIIDAATDTAGVGWILAENWFPYQRPSFVTPPFAGYVSGHSTYSRAAAEVLTLLTGSEYFPGGMGEFVADQNEYLVFEEGPSQTIKLQWAKYQDASDQCSLSRIWGGIHPPADDIPGRKMGHYIGKKAFAYAEKYFTSPILAVRQPFSQSLLLYPNPSRSVIRLKADEKIAFSLFEASGKRIPTTAYSKKWDGNEWSIDAKGLQSGMYFLKTSKGAVLKLIKL